MCDGGMEKKNDKRVDGFYGRPLEDSFHQKIKVHGTGTRNSSSVLRRAVATYHRHLVGWKARIAIMLVLKFSRQNCFKSAPIVLRFGLLGKVSNTK